MPKNLLSELCEKENKSILPDPLWEAKQAMAHTRITEQNMGGGVKRGKFTWLVTYLWASSLTPLWEAKQAMAHTQITE